MYPSQTPAYKRRYRLLHRDQLNAAKNEWRRVHPEKVRQYHQVWVKRHPEYAAKRYAKVRDSLIAARAARRALPRGYLVPPSRLRFWFKRTKMSNRELAERVGVCPAVTYLWMNGRKRPGLDKMIRLLKVVGAPKPIQRKMVRLFHLPLPSLLSKRTVSQQRTGDIILTNQPSVCAMEQGVYYGPNRQKVVPKRMDTRRFLYASRLVKVPGCRREILSVTTQT
jgi:transcriptional regulator with XRE-family HTH domain